MSRLRASRRSWPVIALAMAALVVGVACTSDPEPVETPTPTQAASAPATTPTPTPTPTPEPTADDLLASAAGVLASMSTAKLEMIDEHENGAKFFGTTFKSMEADIETPDSVRMLVSVVAPGLGFARIEILAVGDEAYMKFSEDAPWTPLPADEMPFNFRSVGMTLRDILNGVAAGSIVGREEVDGVDTIRIDGDVTSDDMLVLIPDADPGHPIILSVWLDEADHTLRQMRLDGKLFDDDGAGTSRLLSISVNVPVDIQLPDVASGQ
ncbi:MAG: LppX_LprAFG lipoprotein [Chloroflexi bacterium]|nr:LppX_LprAFG lipoprotein [Chloroflexota bacterium]